MKKIVIGLRLQYLWAALIASILSAGCLLLPYASVGGESIRLMTAAGSSWLVMATLVFTVAAVAAGAVIAVKPSAAIARTWVVLAAVKTALMAVLMFASKGILDGAQLLPGAFLVKNLGIGYWLGLIASLVSLVLAMKLTKLNTGYIILVVLSVLWLFPIAWILLTSLREESGFYVGYFIPKKFTFDNFINLFSNASVLPFGRWWVNTMIVAICGCLINTAIILGTSFTLSRTRFKGRTLFMKILMIIGMFPGFMSMLAVYNILKGIGLNQSLLALVLVGAASAAMGYHVCKGFLDTIPKALDEAATIDGATRWQIFWK